MSWQVVVLRGIDHSAARRPVRLDAGHDGPMAVAVDEPRRSPGAAPGP